VFKMFEVDIKYIYSYNSLTSWEILDIVIVHHAIRVLSANNSSEASEPLSG